MLQIPRLPHSRAIALVMGALIAGASFSHLAVAQLGGQEATGGNQQGTSSTTANEPAKAARGDGSLDEAKSPEPKTPEMLALEAELAAATTEVAKALSAGDLTRLSELCTESAYQALCGETVLLAIDFAGEDQRLAALVEKYKLDAIDLDSIFADVEDMKGAYSKLYAELPLVGRDQIITDCTIVREVLASLRKPLDDSATPADPIEELLGGRILGATLEGNIAIVESGYAVSELSDEDLEMMGVSREDLEKVGYPSGYNDFEKSDSGWLYAGLNVAKTMKSYDALASIMPELEGLPLIEDIQFSGVSLSGDKIDLKDLRGKVVLIDFWGTWCGPCIASLPGLTELYEELHAEGFEVIGIAADDKETLAAFLAEKPLPWQNIVDAEGEISSSFGIQGYPSTLLIDRNGQNVFNALGNNPDLHDKVRELVKGEAIQQVQPQDQPEDPSE